METGIVGRPWALELPLSSATALAPLRVRADLRVGVAGESVWLRGDALDEVLRKRLLGLPATNRYSVSPEGVLTPWGRITPTGRLPAANWSPLGDWGVLSLPTLAWPAERPSAIRLELIRDNSERPCGGLSTSWHIWAAYVASAPQIRLDGLAFALNAERLVLVRGAVLPPIPGVRLIDEHGVFVPAGWYWTPAVDGLAVRDVFGLRDGECAYWPSSERWQRLPGDAWVKASRSAVRATEREMPHV